VHKVADGLQGADVADGTESRKCRVFLDDYVPELRDAIKRERERFGEFVSPEIRERRPYNEPIAAAIQKSDFIVLFTSEDFCMSPHAPREVKIFRMRSGDRFKSIIEVELEPNIARKEFRLPQEPLARVNRCDFKAESERVVRELLAYRDAFLNSGHAASGPS
jgi:hypothetical protein